MDNFIRIIGAKENNLKKRERATKIDNGGIDDGKK